MNACRTCEHPDRLAMEAERASGVSLPALSARFGIGRMALSRHFAGRHPSALTPAPESILDTFERGTGHPAFGWQRPYLSHEGSIVLLKGRQIGASTGAAVKVVHTALQSPGSTSVIVSPTQKQSGEILSRARVAALRLAVGLRKDSASALTLANGSRVISLPGSAKSVRGYTADGVLVLDEAAFLEDETWLAAQALVAASEAPVVVQSTPYGGVGAFAALWQSQDPAYLRLQVRSDEVVSAEWLDIQRRRMSPGEFRQEFEADIHATGFPVFWSDEDWRNASRVVLDD
jgi:hypothetical protein